MARATREPLFHFLQKLRKKSPEASPGTSKTDPKSTKIGPRAVVEADFRRSENSHSRLKYFSASSLSACLCNVLRSQVAQPGFHFFWASHSFFTQKTLKKKVGKIKNPETVPKLSPPKRLFRSRNLNKFWVAKNLEKTYLHAGRRLKWHSYSVIKVNDE